MKKALLIGLAVLVILIFAYAFFGPGAKTNPYPEPTPTDAVGAESEDAEKFVASFYQWYILNLSQNPYFPSLDVRDEVMEPWTTEAFLDSWRTAEQTLEGDYILQTGKEDPLSSGTEIAASLVSRTSRSTIVEVTIGTGVSALVNHVEVVQQGGTWKIDSITSL